MSDERLREAERRWKESGSVEDEARFMAEKIRAGAINSEQLAVAALSGCRVSRIHLSVVDPTEVLRFSLTAASSVRSSLAADTPRDLDLLRRCLAKDSSASLLVAALGLSPDYLVDLIANRLRQAVEMQRFKGKAWIRPTLGRALKERDDLAHPVACAVHLLLALLYVEATDSADLLREMGMDYSDAKEETRALWPNDCTDA